MTSISETRRLFWQTCDPNDSVPEMLEKASRKIKRMTPEEFKASLIRARIITEDGKLTEAYKIKD